MTTTEERDLVGTTLGPYRLEALLGRGGVGEVYRAVDTRKNRVVALKLLAPQFAADQEFRARFRRESELVARLNNQNIVPVHDFGEIDGRLFLEMRLVDGPNLGTLLSDEGPMSPQRAAGIVTQIAAALAAAHSRGLIHRDVKPTNILTIASEVGGGDFACLADFGVARSMGGDSTTSLSGAATTVGTLEYMAPERFVGDDFDHRVDVYALGCVLYECLTGVRPYPVRGLHALMHAHLDSTVPRASERVAGIAPALDEVAVTAMAKDPDRRYATAGAMAEAVLAAVATSASGIPSPRASQESSGTADTRVDTTAPPGQPRPEPGRPPYGNQGPYANPYGNQSQPWQQWPPPAARSRSRLWIPLAIVGVLVLVLGTIATAALLTREPTPPMAPLGPDVSVSSAPQPPISPAPVTPATPTSSYSVTQMFGSGNGDCVPQTPEQLFEGETDGIVCREPGSTTTTFFSEYSSSTDDYLRMLRTGNRSFSTLGFYDCADHFTWTATGNDGVTRTAVIAVYRAQPFSVLVVGGDGATTVDQLQQEKWTVADVDGMCE